MQGDSAPQTGYKRFHPGWTVALACLPVTMANGAVFFSFSVFFKPVAADFNWSRGQVSLIYSALLLAYAPGAILSGRLADRHGPRMVLGVSAALIGAGLVLSSLAHSLGQMAASYSLVGLGVSATLGVPTATVQRWFMVHRGLALGVVSGGVGVGAMLFSPLTHYFIVSYGWRSAFFLLGLLLGAMVALGALTMRANPEKRGIEPYGWEPGRAGTANTVAGVGSFNASVGQAVRTRAFAGLLVANTIAQLPGYFLLAHIVPYATDKGITPGAAAGALGVMGAFNVLGRLGLGPWGERAGWTRAVALSSCACALAVLWLIVVRELWMLYIFIGAYGFFWGGRLPPLMGSVAFFFGTGSLAELIGIMLASSLIIGAAAPFLAGFVFDQVGSYSPVLVASAALFFAGGVLFLLLKPPQHSTQ